MKSRRLNREIHHALEGIDELKSKHYAIYFDFNYRIRKVPNGDELIEFDVINLFEPLPLCLNLSTIDDFRKDIGAKEAQICFGENMVVFYPQNQVNPC